MKLIHIILAAVGVLLTACSAAPVSDSDFRSHQECPPGCICTCEDLTGTASSTDDTASSGTADPSTSTSSGSGDSSSGGSQLAFDCPNQIVNGVNTFCGDGLPCRDAFIEQSGVGGPISFHWYGTYGTIASVLPWGSAAATRSMVASEGGILVVPEADPEAVGGRDPSLSPVDGLALNPFPWWIVGDHDNSVEQTDRPDDFLLMDAILTCLDGQYDPARITTGGASAGAIMSSYLLGERDDIAGAAIWSGGTAFSEPLVPVGNASAIILHGGEPDQYCGVGVEECYGFLEPSESLAADLVNAGHFAFLCDFGEGQTVPPAVPGATHTDAMATQGVEFLRLATTTSPHPWESYPIGPDLPNGGNWMLDHYCYLLGGTHADWGQ